MKPLTAAELETFTPLSAALDAARKRAEQGRDFETDWDLVNEPEIFAAFAQLNEVATAGDALRVLLSNIAPAVLESVESMDLAPDTPHHLCAVLALYATIELRAS